METIRKRADVAADVREDPAVEIDVPDDQRDDLARIGHALAYPIAHLKLTGASDALIMRLICTQAPTNPAANLAGLFERGT